MIADLSHSRACRSSPSHAHWRLKIAFPFVFLVLCPSQIVERQTTYSSSPRQAKGTSSVHLARGLLQPSKWPIGGDGVALRVPLKRTPTATTTTTTTAADKSTVTDIGHAPPTPPFRPPCSGSRLRSRCHALWRSPAVIDPPERVPLKRTAYCYHHHRHHSRLQVDRHRHRLYTSDAAFAASCGCGEVCCLPSHLLCDGLPPGPSLSKRVATIACEKILRR